MCDVKNKISGFTLIELSIVLVIIGLIVGGIVGGQSLIKQSRLSAVITEFKSYETAFNTFELQYDAYPGDFREADDYWPGNLCDGSCDGNSNGLIDSLDESMQAWKHLSLAEIIAGQFSGADIGGDGLRYVLQAQGGEFANIPSSTFGKVGGGQGAGFVFAHPTCSQWDPLSYETNILLGIIAPANDGASCSIVGPFTTAEVRSVDSKLDDGVFETGKFIGNTVGTPSCYNASLSHHYAVGNTESRCSGAYVLR